MSEQAGKSTAISMEGYMLMESSGGYGRVMKAIDPLDIDQNLTKIVRPFQAEGVSQKIREEVTDTVMKAVYLRKNDGWEVVMIDCFDDGFGIYLRKGDKGKVVSYYMDRGEVIEDAE